MLIAVVSITPAVTVPISPVMKTKISAAIRTALRSEVEKEAAAKRPMPFNAPDCSETIEMRNR